MFTGHFAFFASPSRSGQTVPKRDQVCFKSVFVRHEIASTVAFLRTYRSWHGVYIRGFLLDCDREKK
jgi:hypothetical protein